ncbi:MAG: hypothetical protein HFG85_04170 [Dorea sp.]|nr:hypothetical protein [Dorea sp.]
MKKLSDDWIDIDKIVLYGWGNIGKKCFPKLKKDLFIVGRREYLNKIRA